METVTSHNDNSVQKEQQQLSKQARVISTRNVIPNNRPVTKEDVTNFVEKRKELISKNKDKETIIPTGPIESVNTQNQILDNIPEEKKYSDEYKKLYGLEDGPTEQPTESWTPQEVEAIKTDYDNGDIAEAQGKILDKVEKKTRTRKKKDAE